MVRSVYASGSLDHKVHYYYNDRWQLLEEFIEVSGTINEHPQSSYLWHPYYIDALALRLYDESVDGNAGTQYYLHDANYNVTSVWDGSQALERYSYSPYGEVTFLNPDYSTKSSQTTGIGNTHFFTGRELDSETGLQLNRMRFYASNLGSWITRDPIAEFLQKILQSLSGAEEQAEFDVLIQSRLTDLRDDGTNLYRYIRSAPTTKTDPSGLWGGRNWDRCLRKKSLRDCQMCCDVEEAKDGMKHGSTGCRAACKKCHKPPTFASCMSDCDASCDNCVISCPIVCAIIPGYIECVGVCESGCFVVQAICHKRCRSKYGQ